MDELASSRSAGQGRQLSSRWLASLLALGYLAVAGTVGVSILAAPRDEPLPATAVNLPAPTVSQLPSPSWSGPSTSRSSDPRPSTPEAVNTPTTRPPPAGYRRVAGPAGIRTVVPASWVISRTTGPGAMQAVDPADKSTFVKYGGSPAPAADIETTHVRYENAFAARTPGYARIDLSRATYAGHQAVEWEFNYRANGTTHRMRSLYWRVDGTEYVVLAASPAAKWTETSKVYTTMVRNAAP